MERYRELAALRCFTHEDMARLTGTESSAEWEIRKCLQRGYIERVRRDLYAVVSMETGYPIPNRYEIASRVTDDACVSHHSAFECYGCANQVFYEVYFTTAHRVRPFSHGGIRYCPVLRREKDGIIHMANGIRVTSPERTVIDSIADFKKIGGLEELLRCLLLVPSLDWNKLLDALKRHGRSQLYQKAGYILETWKEDLSLPETFFEECEKRSSSSKTYLFEKRRDFVLHDRWKLFAPKDLEAIINKGVADYDAL